MRKFKSLITVLAITVTSAALFTGCRNKGSNDSNSSSQLQAESKQTQLMMHLVMKLSRHLIKHRKEL